MTEMVLLKFEAVEYYMNNLPLIGLALTYNTIRILAPLNISSLNCED